MAHRCFLRIFCMALCLMTFHCHQGTGPADGPVMMGDMADPMDLAQAVGDAGDQDLHVTDDAAITDGGASPDGGDDAAVGDAAPAMDAATTDGPATDAAMTDGPPRDSGAMVDSGIDGGGGSCTGMGFGAATDFTLPTGFNKGGFSSFESGLSCDSFNSINQPRFSVRQLVGSARLDLVLTQACNPATYTRDPTVGVSRWIVY